MRRALDALYAASMYLAGTCLVGVFVAVLSTVVGRFADFNPVGSDAYAGYLMAAASFLALGGTLRRCEHIRVSLALGAAAGPLKKALEYWCYAVGVVVSSALAWFSWRLVWQSRMFEEISQASDATPLWLPQISMAIGCTVFAVAMVDLMVSYLLGKSIELPADEPARVE